MSESIIRWLCASLCAGVLLGACEENGQDCFFSGEDVDQACLDGCVLSRVICQEQLEDWDPCFAIEAECSTSCGE